MHNGASLLMALTGCGLPANVVVLIPDESGMVGAVISPALWRIETPRWVVGQFDCNRINSYFFGDGRFPLVLTTATDDPSCLMMYFVVIVTVPSLLLVSVLSVLFIRGLLNLADEPISRPI